MAYEFEYVKVISPVIKPTDVMPSYPWTASSFDAFQHKWAVVDVATGKEISRGVAASKAAAQTALNAAYNACFYPSELPGVGTLQETPVKLPKPRGVYRYPSAVPAADSP